jgi:putative flippase GtrA
MCFLQKSHPTVKRWFIFNSIGAMGIAIQLGTLFVLTSCAGMSYLAATALAVETAVIHNFFWHERWTWADRTRVRRLFLRRFLAFHLSNGAVSIVGNLILMRLFVNTLGLNLMPANTLAIALCSTVNFLAGDIIVFREAGNPSTKGGAVMEKTSCRAAIRKIVSGVVFWIAGITGIQAADLQPETAKAWIAGVENVERRMSAEMTSGRGFLALDFQNSGAAARERQEVLSGKIPVKQVPNPDGQPVKMRNGMVHHWRGSVFIPGATLDFVLSRVANPRPEDSRQEDVLDSRVLESSPGQLRLYLKLQRSKIVTVAYNTEHLVRYRRHGTEKASSSSVATRIVEIEDFRGRSEREKPEGHDHGYLWRMNSYWRYQEVKGGVIVECESMTLSRSIPTPLEWVIRPLINSVAEESMKRTLESMRNRLAARQLASLSEK